MEADLQATRDDPAYVGPNYPDVIMSNAKDPAMVRALLGNGEESDG